MPLFVGDSAENLSLRGRCGDVGGDRTDIQPVLSPRVTTMTARWRDVGKGNCTYQHSAVTDVQEVEGVGGKR